MPLRSYRYKLIKFIFGSEGRELYDYHFGKKVLDAIQRQISKPKNDISAPVADNYYADYSY